MLLFGWLVLIIDQLFWSVPMPPVTVLSWCVLRPFADACVLLRLCERTPDVLESPWELLMHAYLFAHGVTIWDEPGSSCSGGGDFCSAGASPTSNSAAGAAQGSEFALPGIAAYRGAVLMNHRSWGDFCIDQAQSRATVVARGAAVGAALFTGLLGLASRRLIPIFRSRGPCGIEPTTREELMRLCAKHERYCLYPEGTRRATDANSENPVPLRVGGLKNIYESGDSALIVITVGKEKIINERVGHVSFSTRLYRATHPPLLSTDHPSLESFLSAVDEAWRSTWRRAYQLRNDQLDLAWSERQPASPGDLLGQGTLLRDARGGAERK